jgi:hypothetical protein
VVCWFSGTYQSPKYSAAAIIRRKLLHPGYRVLFLLFVAALSLMRAIFPCAWHIQTLNALYDSTLSVILFTQTSSPSRNHVIISQYNWTNSKGTNQESGRLVTMQTVPSAEWEKPIRNLLSSSTEGHMRTPETDRYVGRGSPSILDWGPVVGSNNRLNPPRVPLTVRCCGSSIIKNVYILETVRKSCHYGVLLLTTSTIQMMIDER